MTKSTVFSNNKTQAVRLPKAVALPESVKRVEIIKQGRGRLIVPEGNTWDAFFDSLPASEDFLADRDQPDIQERESL
jgi:antitoxin VapB